MLTDIHTHLAQHDSGEVDGIVQRAREAGVSAILLAGTTVNDSCRSLELAERYDLFHACVGIHPQELSPSSDLRDIDRIADLARGDKVVAISETGLDYQPTSVSATVQIPFFERQLELAADMDLPVVFHNRAATAATIAILRRFKGLRGAAHYFDGDLRYAETLVGLGWHISFSKILLGSKKLQEVAKETPLEHIVVETDSYPQTYKPDRAKWTEPRDLVKVADGIARIKGVSVEEVAAATSRNAAALFGTPS